MSNNGRKRASGAGVKKPTGTALVPVESVNSLARVPNMAANEVARDGDAVRVTGVPYLAHGVPVPAAEIYFDGEVRPKQEGPWLGEADKVAWRDPVTGFECIIMRAQPGGFLGGYVGVLSDHPLHEFAADAIPGNLGIEVHGGITYAAMCEDGPTPQPRLRYEARRICHVVLANTLIDKQRITRSRTITPGGSALPATTSPTSFRAIRVMPSEARRWASRRRTATTPTSTPRF